MKKLLVLMLVFGMASLASATLQLTISAAPDPGQPFTVTLSGAAGDLVDPALYGAIESDIVADSHRITSNVAIGSTTDNFGSYGTYDFNIGYGNVAMGYTVAGDWVVLTFTAGAADTTYGFAIQDSSYATISGSGASVTVVPEPMTMALLGIGGLFLRRRK